MRIAGTADAFNRQLHQREVDAIKAHAEGFQRFAKQRGVILTEAQAEARLIRTMTRVADKQTTIDDGYRQDELAISYLGHNFIDVTPEDYKTSDINWDVVYNNPQTFANAQLYSGSGLTPQEVETRNNSAGAPVAKVLAASLAAYAVAPYALTAMDSCLLNPVLCVNELGLVAGEVALEGSGLGVTGKSALKNSGKVPGGSVVTIPQGGDIAKGASFSSPDKHVSSVANAIEKAYPGHVVGVNVPVRNSAGDMVTDADILLKNAVIQVKSGGGKGMTSQLQRTEHATGLPTIGYGPDLKQSILKNSTSTNDLQLLIDVVKP